MNIAVWLVLFSSLAPTGLAHAQGTMSGMTNSMRSGPLMAPAGQGQGPHDIGKGLAEDQFPSGRGEGRSDSIGDANPGNSSGTAGGGVGAGTRGDRGGTAAQGKKPAHGDSGGAAPMLR